MKHAKLADKMAQVEEDLRSRDPSLRSFLKVRRDRTAQFEKDCVDNVARVKDVLPDRPGAYNAVKCQQKRKDKTLCARRAKS